MVKHINFIRWMKNSGAELSRTKLVVYAKDYRGLHATVPIGPFEEILSVPINLTVSSGNLEATEFGRKLMEKQTFDSKWMIYIFPLLYMLDELKNPNSEFKEWLDVMPHVASEHPMFFTPEERKWLAGSTTLGNAFSPHSLRPARCGPRHASDLLQENRGSGWIVLCTTSF